jgi:hypothetical protein
MNEELYRFYTVAEGHNEQGSAQTKDTQKRTCLFETPSEVESFNYILGKTNVKKNLTTFWLGRNSQYITFP